MPEFPNWLRSHAEVDPAVLEQFAEAWNNGRRPAIDPFLARARPETRLAVLAGLVYLDLAGRAAAGEAARLENYLEHYPALAEDPGLFLELVSAEEALHRARDPECTILGYDQRFPRLADRIAGWLADHPATAEWSPRARRSGPALAAADAGDAERLGRYRVLGRLSAGGFGVVYKGFDEDLRREVAIKVPHRHRVESPEDVEEYLAEGRALAKLDHPGIVPVHDVGRTPDGSCYLVSKYVAGSDLARRLAAGRPSLTEAVDLVATVAEALHHAHQRGLVHRDVKPANVLLAPDGAPVVADFGFALRDEDFGTGPTTGGTPAYMSPEQVRGEGHRVDARTDVYSLGVVLYEMLTGQRPFKATDTVALLDQILNQEPRPPRQLDDTIPRELDRICLKCLAKRAADRYSTARDLAEDLRHWQDSTARSAPPANREIRPAQVEEAEVAAISTPSNLPAVAPAPETISNRGPVRTVPKGLRSFDAEDANFFLELLPGPRDRDGLPNGIRFWKSRIEGTNPDEALVVGLLYGPSGCGKSSLVKAGLLPRLSDRVLPIYIEATAGETESRLLKSLRRRCPSLPDDLGLVETLATLRRRRGRPVGKRLLLVIDQFEQWLHAHRGETNPEFVQALRQCDGQTIQCLVLVRDDFWMAATRFLHALEVPLREGHNAAAVDLFDPRHARKVLAEFGRAFGCLPEDLAARTVDQDRFLDQAVDGLTRDGKVISVRLSLFAEMVKGRPWAPATLKEVGGTEGLGVTFLEETFGTSASPEHRLHQRAARAVLKSLLPEAGTNIKGHRRSREELLQLSGYATAPRKFEDLMRILDGELRLVTPTDPEGLEPSDAPAEGPTASAPGSGPSYYQLTHDYLVPALRDWLTRKQRETRRGRAELRLEELTALWSLKKESRHLPSWWTWLTVGWHTRRQRRTPAQAAIMRASRRFHGSRLAVRLLLLLVLGWGGFEAFRYFAAYIQVQGLDKVTAGNREMTLDALRPYRRWAVPRIVSDINDHQLPPEATKHALWILARLDPGQADYLCDRLLTRPHEFEAIVDGLGPQKAQVAGRLWKVLENPNAKPGEQVHAACALVVYDPDRQRFAGVSRTLAQGLMTYPSAKVVANQTPVGAVASVDLEPSSSGSPVKRPITAVSTSLLGSDEPLALPVIRLLEKFGDLLADPFLDSFRLAKPFSNERHVAATFALMAAPQKAGLAVEVVQSMERDMVSLVLSRRVRYGKDTVDALIRFFTRQLNSEVSAKLPSSDKAKRTLVMIEAARALLELDKPEPLMELLKLGSDPALRTLITHSLGFSFANQVALRVRLNVEKDLSVRRAVLFCLLRTSNLRTDQERWQLLYRDDPDPGIHSLVAWALLSRDPSSLQVTDLSLSSKGPVDGRGWYINGEGHTLAILPTAAEFLMGSPDSEAGRTGENETQHRRRIPRRVALGTKEVTVSQFLRFRKNRRDSEQSNDWVTQQGADHPVLGVTWFDAVRYCRWLSEMEGVSESEMCYPPLPQIKEGMKLPADYLRRTGYRLPTEAEWEYACRAGSTTARALGSSNEFLGNYCWYLKNSHEPDSNASALMRGVLSPDLSGSERRAHKVGLKEPNDFGLFDLYGNVAEWCHDRFLPYPRVEKESVMEDREDLTPVSSDVSRAVRGGAFDSPASELRSAARDGTLPNQRKSNIGFRIARTMPK